jgi:hypothetical protein
MSFFQAQDEFRDLPESDRQRLLDVNGPMWNQFRYSVTVVEPNGCMGKLVQR